MIILPTLNLMKRKLPSKTIEYNFPLIPVLCCLFVFSLKSWSQKNDSIVPVEQNPKKILRKIDIQKLNKNNFYFWEDTFTAHWAGIDFGFNGFLNPDYTGYASEFMENNIFRSNSTYINAIQQSIGLQRNRNTIGLVTGIGLHLQSYRLNQNTTIRRSENGIIEPEILYFDQNQKSKLSIVSLMLPLLVEFQIPVNHYENRLYFSGGLFAEARLSSHTKIKYRADGKKEKLKVPDHYSIRNFRYGTMVRAGYRRINLFASFDLIPLFIEDKGPVLTPFTFGFTFIRF